MEDKKFYTGEDFKDMVKELLRCDSLYHQVSDYLSYHYSRAVFTNKMSRLTWFALLRKTLFDSGYSDYKKHIKLLPPQIREAFKWGLDESLKLVKSFPSHQIKTKTEENVKNLIENPYPRIFKNLDSYLLFEILRKDVRQRYQLADFSFIYRRMQKDGYIYKKIVDTEFRDFLLENFHINIDKTKLLEYCVTDSKEVQYKTKKQLFQYL